MSEEWIRIIIPTRNNEKIILACLGNIFNQTYKRIKVTIIDDCSEDRTVKLIKKFYPQAEVITNQEVQGPAKNRNIAASQISENWILFLDSDAYPEKNWLSRAFPIIQKDKRIGILGGKIFYTKKSKEKRRAIQSRGGYMHISGIIGLYKTVFSGRKEYIWLPSSTFLVSKKVFNQIGGFDQNFFYLIEDNDLCWRTIIAGYKVVYNKNLISLHQHSKTAQSTFKKSRVAYLTKRNKMLMLFKNYEITSLIKYLPVITFVILLETISLDNPLAILRGNLAPFKHLKTIVKQRGEIKKYRRTKDKKIIGRLISPNLLATLKLIKADGYVKAQKSRGN